MILIAKLTVRMEDSEQLGGRTEDYDYDNEVKLKGQLARCQGSGLCAEPQRRERRLQKEIQNIRLK